MKERIYKFPINNFNNLKEAIAKYQIKNNDDNIREFLDFWQEVYDAWCKKYSPYDMRYTEDKVKGRKALIKLLGISPSLKKHTEGMQHQ